jgi:hypothetical protein
MSAINIIFDGPPSHNSGRFVEVENDQGESISIGEWIERDDGYWSLRISSLPQPDHIHKNNPESDGDDCAICGLDLRNAVHMKVLC